MPKTTKKTTTSKSSKTKSTPKKESKSTKSTKNIISAKDFVMLDYVGRIKDSNQIFDLTKEDIAHNENIFDEKQVYGPQLLVLGEGQFMQGFETRLEGTHVGQEVSFELPPEEGFGLRDSKKIKIENIRDFRNQNIKPKVGQRVRIGQKSGTVIRVGGGRVVVDYNPPLAGKTLNYTVWILEKLTTEKQKISSLIARRTGPQLADQFKISNKTGVLEINVPQAALYAQQLQLTKAGIALDLLKYLSKIKIVRFIETHERPKSETPKKKSSSTKKSRKPKGK